MDMNQLLNDITNAEISKKELENQLAVLTNEYELETKELQRLNDKNIEYSNALKEQESQKQLKNDTEKREQDKIALNNFVDELSQMFKR